MIRKVEMERFTVTSSKPFDVVVAALKASKSRCSLENFTLDAERWLAALYWCVRTSYGDDAAHAAADCWLRVFEEQLEGSSDLPELTRISAAAIALFVSRLVLTGQCLIEVSGWIYVFSKLAE